MKILAPQALQAISLVKRLLKNKRATKSAVMLILSMFCISAFAQNVPIKGRVTNSAGQGVVNASVTVKGGGTGVSSSETGEFEISAPPNAVLVISSVGYSPREVSVNGQQNLSVTLVTAADLEQVVVVGYGTQRKT